MFYYLDGTVAHTEPFLAVIDCGGVGYACRTTNNTLAKLKKDGRVRLYTYLNVGDGVFDLYGFASQAELGSFRQLLGVSGVGPKAALAILSLTTPEGLTSAVITGDVKTLTAAPGVGKKIAQRIILELKDKLTKEKEESGFVPLASAEQENRGKASEAAQALAVLGYSQQDISVAMKGLDADALSLEELIRQALRRMVK